MTDPVTGKPCGIHRTYLERDGRGKAAIDGPRRMLGAAGVIRLADPSAEGLGLAEGIETALSCMQTIGWGPVWAAGVPLPSQLSQYCRVIRCRSSPITMTAA